MKFKNNFKRFFNMNRCHEAGFTLVELIVVIAILAILAGVAVPAYSGYIARAEKAGDMQLLGAVNTAFAAACMDEGIATTTVQDAKLTMAAGKVTGVTSVTYDAGTKTTLSGNSVEDLSESFMLFFTGNENTAFKSIKSLYFNPMTHTFEEMPEDGEVTMYIGDKAVTIDAKDAANLAQSTFAEQIGSEKLLGKVDSVSGIAAMLLGDSGKGSIDILIYGNYDETDPNAKGVALEGYFQNLALSLGLQDKEGETAGLQLQNMAIEAGVTDLNAFLANSLVLTAAKNTSTVSTDAMGTAGYADGLKNRLDDPNTASSAMAEAALALGMYTAYANSSACTDPSLKDKADAISAGDFGELTTVLKDLEDQDSEFSKYMNSKEGKADLEAYKSAMNMINDATTSSPDAAVNVMVNGFTDDDLAALLGQIMGN